MKLRQKEYCHNCDQQVMFEFEDTNERQVINCPNCGHEHYREIDNATLLDIYVDMTRGPQYIRVAKMPKFNYKDLAEGTVPDEIMLCEVEEHEVLGVTPEGKAIVKSKYKDGEEVTKVVTDRRWGVDPRQRNR